MKVVDCETRIKMYIARKKEVKRRVGWRVNLCASSARVSDWLP